MISNALAIATRLLVKPFEGYHKRLPDGGCKAYPDPATRGDPWTIGYGSTGPDIDKDTVWSQDQAEHRLMQHMLYFATKLLVLSPSLARASDRRFAAVISFAYNCGLGNYRVSTFKKRVDAGDWEGAQKEIVKWNKAAGRVLPGLTRRRAAEAAFLA